MSDFCFESESNSYMRGMATLQTFEELPCQESDNREVRKHLHFCLHAHTHSHKGGRGKNGSSFLSELNRFIVNSNSLMRESSLLQDEQSDSGMVLQSEEMKHVAWSNSTKNKKLSRW